MDAIKRLGRLQQRIKELEDGKTIDANHINVLLSEERQSEFDREWQHQKQLRKIKKPAALNSGWKTKREIRLELLRTTLAELQDNIVPDLEQEQKAKQVRAARVFMDAYSAAAEEGKNARAAANAALQRNGFEREDILRRRGCGMRDVEVLEMEELLIERFKATLTQEELDQLRMLEEKDG
ncbi:hypothetical protein ACFLZU_02010 [Thermodesulfobacteriota bacterium]